MPLGWAIGRTVYGPRRWCRIKEVTSVLANFTGPARAHAGSRGKEGSTPFHCEAGFDVPTVPDLERMNSTLSCNAGDHRKKSGDSESSNLMCPMRG
jgi:hypothetical protein